MSSTLKIRQLDPLQKGEFQLYVQTTPYPWHETYVNGQRIHAYSPCDAGKTVFNLFEGLGAMQVYPGGDAWLPIP